MRASVKANANWRLKAHAAAQSQGQMAHLCCLSPLACNCGSRTPACNQYDLTERRAARGTRFDLTKKARRVEFLLQGICSQTCEPVASATPTGGTPPLITALPLAVRAPALRSWREHVCVPSCETEGEDFRRVIIVISLPSHTAWIVTSVPRRAVLLPHVSRMCR